MTTRVRAQRKNQSRFGKWLLLLEEEDGRRLWTRRRYVSAEEIEAVRRRWLSVSPGSAAPWTRPEYTPVHVMVERGYYSDLEATIRDPGFYRVEPTSPSSIYFTRVCSGGIPWHHRNADVRYIDQILREREHKGLDTWHDNMNRKQKLQESKSRWRKDRIDGASREFFTAIAMAGGFRA
jgi:hypothetical protein